MHIHTRLLAAIALLLVSLSSSGAEPLAPEAMFARLSALESSGNPEVAYNLGMFLNNGIGTQANPAAAFKRFQAAAAAGHELAAYKVGCYLAGQFPGVAEENQDDALKYKLRAAEGGYDLAQYDVGMYFAKKRDLANALPWWERSSHQGNLEATAILAAYYASKASPNKIKGYALLNLLKEQLPDAGKDIDNDIAGLGATLTRTEREKADALLSGWLTGKTPLSQKAAEGIEAVPDLLAQLEH